MLTKKFLPIAASILGMITLLSSPPASAEMVKVGENSDGTVYFLDTDTMMKRDEDFGTVIKVYAPLSKADYFSQYSLKPACGDERLFLVGSRLIYDGRVIETTKLKEETRVRNGSPFSNAMTYYCKSIGARGW
ncbi:hypothetical protein [Anabaena catenula]|uniref:CpcD n=1 Tax=Anabaena catenula FACHB-362 TaxID=2692877 RepID=A0ABR8JBL1_9NOST|nr:hypothetical protein [Anabaena catenula]MBD2694848.1 hypothetical protein [Anabaena catenula FACHB-362]